MADLKCLRCQGDMEKGFTLDASHGAVRVSPWVQGEFPEQSFWFGMNLKGRDQRRIVSWRCTKCGYLESYAEKLVE